VACIGLDTNLLVMKQHVVHDVKYLYLSKFSFASEKCGTCIGRVLLDFIAVVRYPSPVSNCII